MTAKTTVEIRLPADQVAFIDLIAGLSGESREAVVTVMLATYVADEKRKYLATDDEVETRYSKLLDSAVEKFLCWKVPSDFAPDAGVSFKPNSKFDSAH